MPIKKSLLELIEERLQDDQTLLPPFDRTALQIQKELARPEPDVARIEKYIVADPALTAQVLRTANSAFYRGLTKVGTVHNAIFRLGMAEIASIVLMVTQQRNYNARTATGRRMMADLWRHSVGCAIGSQWLARMCGYQNLAHEAFTAGLLHDVGKLLLLTVIETVAEKASKIDLPEALVEEILQRFHPEYGERLMRQWNLPESYCRVAREHHAEDFDRENGLLLIVRVVNAACAKLGIGVKKDPFMVLAAMPETSLLGISEVRLAELEIKLEDAAVLAVT